jgi:hypothetical protein
MKTEIEKYDPCTEAVEFRKQFETFQEAWEACPRGDWMLWIAQRLGVDLRILTLAKGHCANTVRHLMKDDRSIKAVDTAIAFGEGRASEKDLDAAAAASYAAASYDAAAAAKKENQMQTADICRKYLTEGVFEKLGIANRDLQ